MTPYQRILIILTWELLLSGEAILVFLKYSSIVVYKYGKLFRFILKDVLKEIKLWHASKAIQHSNVPLLNRMVILCKHKKVVTS